jgi:hypothetical protein
LRPSSSQSSIASDALPFCHPACPGKPWEEMICLWRVKKETALRLIHGCEAQRAARPNVSPARQGWDTNHHATSAVGAAHVSSNYMVRIAGRHGAAPNGARDSHLDRYPALPGCADVWPRALATGAICWSLVLTQTRKGWGLSPDDNLPAPACCGGGCCASFRIARLNCKRRPTPCHPACCGSEVDGPAVPLAASQNTTAPLLEHDRLIERPS